MATQFTHPAENLASIDTSRFECIDGQLIERPLTTVKHSVIQGNLTVLLRPLAKAKKMTCGPELSVDRTPGSKSDWMTPDFAVSLPGGYTINQNGHALPPVYLIAEILSSDQTMVEMEAKARRYFEWGAQHIWLIDPVKQEAISLHQDGGRKLVRDGQIEADPDFAISLADILAV